MNTTEAIITAMALREGSVTASSVSSRTGLVYNTAHVTCSRMVRSGYLTRPERGTFTATDYGRVEVETLRQKLEWE